MKKWPEISEEEYERVRDLVQQIVSKTNPDGELVTDARELLVVIVFMFAHVYEMEAHHVLEGVTEALRIVREELAKNTIEALAAKNG